ncbi:hypothetical protein QR680_005283 [Steinernema hermaphroditum]|uniref:Headcase N-terminal domain-containing protein n=1 Tax=Steinernema hermaphroditum TaxID=289476 RepID=A0AA39HSN2_9BILA|nr:hypothetical protein QR680_005283 [Steinernema hermaphroditum]
MRGCATVPRRSLAGSSRRPAASPNVAICIYLLMGKKGRNNSAVCEGQKGDQKKLSGCPIPMKKGCVIGLPLPTKEDGGLKMLCNNESCPFKGQLVHSKCLEVLEETLIKGLEQTGSARGWSDSQRRSNLWGRRGIPLVQRNCRCPCDHGFSVLDINAIEVEQMQAKVQEVNATPVANNAPKKKKKNNNLPALNTGKGKEANRKVEKRLLERDHFRDDDIPIVPSSPKTDPAFRKLMEPVVLLRAEAAPAVNPWNTSKLPAVEPLDLGISLRSDLGCSGILRSKDDGEYSIRRSSTPLSPHNLSEISEDFVLEESPFFAESANDPEEDCDDFARVSLVEFLTQKANGKGKKGKKRAGVLQASAPDTKDKQKPSREFEVPEAVPMSPVSKSNNPWFTSDLQQKQKIYESRSEEQVEHVHMSDLTINTDIVRPITPSTPSSLQSELLAECRELSSQAHPELDFEEIRRMVAEVEPPTPAESPLSLHMAPPPGFEHVTVAPPPGFGHVGNSAVSGALCMEASQNGLLDFVSMSCVNDVLTEKDIIPEARQSCSTLPSADPAHYLNDFVVKRMNRYAQGETYDGLFKGPSFFLGEELLGTRNVFNRN